MPLSYTWGFLQGAQLHFAPTMDAGDPWGRIQSLAHTGSVFVITAASETRIRHYPEDYVEYMKKRLTASNQQPGMLEQLLSTVGGGHVYHPAYAEPMPFTYASDSLTITELNLDDLIEAKFRFDVGGADAKPDVFQLVVNPSAVNIVTVRPW